MSSTDERVVHLRFDNAQFEKGVKTSLSSIQKLKNGLNFKGAADNMKNLQKQVNSFSLAGIASGVESVKQRFDTLGIVGMTVIQNITNAAINAGMQITKSLTIQPILDGFSEYETQINSVQTILANTQKEGTNIDQVNAALDTLNTYADKTIYNFTEMTRNIGTFTAAGVGLQTSVDSIQGIANLAAVSGSTSLQASTAMYQLSQAIAAGTVKLMDWNSVVNAGMGGQVFQDALIRTSEHLQTGAKAAIEAKGSFRESLQEGWLTVDVLTETLKQFSLNVETAEDYEKAMSDLVSQGYTEEEAKSIADMAKTAGEAATKVKTFSQLIDTLKEALGSGWTQTWRTIIGDFEEAKALWTQVSDVLSNMINDSANARNEMVQSWADMGGRQALIDSLWNSFNALMKIVNSVSAGIREVFPAITAEQLLDLTNKLKDFTAGLVLSDEDADHLRIIVSDVAKVLKKVGEIVVTVGRDFKGLIDNTHLLDNGLIGLLWRLDQFVHQVTQTKGFNDAVKGLKSIYEAVKQLATQLSQAINFSSLFDAALNVLSGGFSVVGNVISGVATLITTLLGALTNEVGKVTQGIANLTGGAGTAAQGLTEIFLHLIDVIPEALSAAITAVGQVITSLLEAIPVHEVNSMVQDTLFSVIMYRVSAFLKQSNEKVDEATGIFGKISEIFDKIGGSIDKFAGVLDSAKDSIKAFAQSIQANIILKIAIALGVLALSLKAISGIPADQIAASLGALGGMLAILAASAAGILIFMRKFAKGSEEIKNMGELAKQLRNVALSMLLFAASIRILASAIETMGSMSLGDLAKGLAGVAASVALLVIATKAIGKSDDIIKTCASLIAFSLAIKLLASAIHSFSDLDFGDIAVGIAAIAAACAMLVVSTKILSKIDSGMAKTCIILISFAVSLKILASAMRDFNDVNFDSVLKASIAAAGIVAAVKIISKGLTGLKITKIVGIAAIFVTFSQVLKSMAETFKTYQDIEWSSILKGTTSMLGFFSVLIVTMTILKKAGLTQTFLEVSGGMWAITDALNKFTEAIKVMSGMSVADIAKGLVGIGGGLMIMLKAVGFLPKEQIIQSAAAMVALSLAMKILASALVQMGSMSIGEIAKSLIAIGGSLFILVKAMEGMSKNVNVKTMGKASLALMGFALAISMLAGPIKMLGDMDTASLVQGLIGLSAALAILYIACDKLTAHVKTMGKTAAGLAQLGASLIVLGIGLTAIMYPIKMLGGMDTNQVLSGAVGLSAVIAVLYMLTEAMNTLPSFSLKTVAKLAIMMAVIAGIGAVLHQLASLDPNAALQVATALSGTLLAASAAIAVLGMVPLVEAAKGVATMAIVIGGISAIVVAMGALAQIPGAKWIVSEGKEFLQSIGEAIGSFFGGIVGGVVGGALSSMANALPSVGSSLSDFANNAQPFFDSMKGLDPNIGSAMSNLAVALLAISGAELLDSITSWFTGKATLADFGKQLAEFAPYFLIFSTMVKDIDADAVNGAANAAKSLAEFANNLPKDDGLLQDIMGHVDIVGFGQKMAEFAPYLLEFGNIAKDIDTEAVTGAANAAKTLAEFATNLPKEGGALQAIVGVQDPASFGSKLKGLGEGIAQFAEGIKDVDPDAVTNAANAAKTLTELAQGIPEEGGFLQQIMGSKDLGNFADNLGKLGEGLSNFDGQITKLTFSNINPAIEALQSICEIQSGLTDTGGAAQFFTGSKDLDNFANNMGKLGTGLANYSDNIENVLFGAVRDSLPALSGLMEVFNDLGNTGGLDSIVSGGKDYGAVSRAMKSFGEGFKDYFDSVNGTNPETVESTISPLRNLIDAFNLLDNSGGLDSITNGGKDYTGFAAAGGNLGSGLKSYADAVCDINTEQVEAASSACMKVVDLVNDTAGIDTDGIKNFATTITDIGDMGLPNFNQALSDASVQVAQKLSDLASGINNTVPGLADALNSLHTNLDNATGSMTDSARNLANSTMDALNGAFNDKSGEVTETMTNVCNNIVTSGQDAINSGQDSFKQAGDNLLNALKDAINNGRQNVITVVKNLATDLSASITTNNQAFYQAGLNMMMGLQNGIIAGRSGVITSATKVATDALTATKKALDEHSPSKATAKFGRYYDQGLINGMEDLLHKVRKSGELVGNEALTGLKNSMSGLEINTNSYSPVITPVVDASNLRTLSGFNASKTLTYNARIANAQVISPVRAMQKSFEQEQAATIQSNNEVLESIKGLRSDISSYNETLSNMENAMYVDGKKLASSIAKPMNRELGTLSKRGRL